MKWFRLMEADFRDQQLQPSLEEKQNRLRTFKEKRETIIKMESEIDQFIDKSHGLLNSSGVERIKPIISQISNRYISFFKLYCIYIGKSAFQNSLYYIHMHGLTRSKNKLV